jgi:hypothetical protein
MFSASSSRTTSETWRPLSIRKWKSVPPESVRFCELTVTRPSRRAAASTACAETLDGAWNTISFETDRVSPRGGMPVNPASPGRCAAGPAFCPKLGLAVACRPAAGARTPSRRRRRSGKTQPRMPSGQDWRPAACSQDDRFVVASDKPALTIGPRRCERNSARARLFRAEHLQHHSCRHNCSPGEATDSRDKS